MDTRETSPALLKAVKAACDIMGVKVCNYGLVTTPQLHWLVSENYTDENDTGLYSQEFKENFLTFLSLCDTAALEAGVPEKKNY